MPRSKKRRNSSLEEDFSKKLKHILNESTENSLKSTAKYDQTFILGMHHIEGKDSIEDREYIVYCCNNLKRKYDNKEHPCQLAFYDIFQDDYPDLKNLTPNSRLILVGHGTYMHDTNLIGFAGRDAEQVAEVVFEDCNLQEAKTLKFISCKLGSSAFLDEMKTIIETSETASKVAPQITGYNAPLYVSMTGDIYAECNEEGIKIAKPFKIKK
jgi:hypothetical protein